MCWAVSSAAEGPVVDAVPRSTGGIRHLIRSRLRAGRQPLHKQLFHNPTRPDGAPPFLCADPVRESPCCTTPAAGAGIRAFSQKRWRASVAGRISVFVSLAFDPRRLSVSPRSAVP